MTTSMLGLKTVLQIRCGVLSQLAKNGRRPNDDTPYDMLVRMVHL